METPATFESDALKLFLSSHTKLNNFIKISAAALDFLRLEENDSSLSLRINELILKSGERWTPRVFRNPKDEIAIVYNDLIKSGIVWVYSSFDVFFKQVEGIFSEDFNTNGGVGIMQQDNGEIPKIIGVFRKMDWDERNIVNLIPILSFYEAVRHCIAHNAGHPNSLLLRIYESSDFNNAIVNWKTKFDGKGISPAPIITSKSIDLRPHHAITYSEACRRIAVEINARIFEKFGQNHFILTTIKNHIINISTLSNPQCSTYLKYIAFHLNKDYGIRLTDIADIYDIYSDEDEKKRHISKYNSLKQN